MTDSLWHRLLYVKKSDYYSWNAVTDSFDIDVNDGLFSRQSYLPGDLVVKFNGRLINWQNMKLRQGLGFGGYFVECIPNRLYIDCFDSRHIGGCLASCANSAHKNYPLRHKKFFTFAKSNVQIQVAIEGDCWTAKYIASRHIVAGEEIFGEYEPYLP